MLNLLLVEDDPDLRSVIEAMLSNAGYEVLTAADGSEALAVMTGRGYCADIVLTDVIMPKLRGMDLAKQVVKFCPDTKILFMSGFVNLDENEFDPFRDRCAFLQKPFTSDDLIEKIEELHQKFILKNK